MDFLFEWALVFTKWIRGKSCYGYAPSPSLFVVVMDKVTRYVQDDIP